MRMSARWWHQLGYVRTFKWHDWSCNTDSLIDSWLQRECSWTLWSGVVPAQRCNESALSDALVTSDRRVRSTWAERFSSWNMTSTMSSGEIGVGWLGNVSYLLAASEAGTLLSWNLGPQIDSLGPVVMFPIPRQNCDNRGLSKEHSHCLSRPFRFMIDSHLTVQRYRTQPTQLRKHR